MVSTDFVWSGQNLVSEKVGETVTDYTYDVTGTHMKKNGSTVQLYMQDHMGSTQAHLTATGEMVESMSDKIVYDSFGSHINNMKM